MKKKQLLFSLFFVGLSILSLTAHAQVDGRASPEAQTMGSSRVSSVNQVLDKDLESRKKIYDSLDQKSVIQVNLKDVATENVERTVDEVMNRKQVVPDRLELAISGAKTEYDRNKIIEYVRKAAARRKAKLEAEAALKSQQSVGASTVGGASKVGNSDSTSTQGQFSITGGLGRGGHVFLQYCKKFF